MGCCQSKPKPGEYENPDELATVTTSEDPIIAEACYAETKISHGQIQRLIREGKCIYTAKKKNIPKDKKYLAYDKGDIIMILTESAAKNRKSKAFGKNISKEETDKDPNGRLVDLEYLEKIEDEDVTLATRPALPTPSDEEYSVSNDGSVGQPDGKPAAYETVDGSRPLPSLPKGSTPRRAPPETPDKPTLSEDEPGVLIALYDYDEASSGTLTFNKGEKFQEISRDGDWSKCKRLTTGEVGYLPMNFVAREAAVRGSALISSEEHTENESNEDPAILDLLKGKKTQKVIMYFKGGSTDETFQKGEIVSTLKETGDWVEVRKLSTDRRGFLPLNYIAPEDDLIHNEWYHGNLTKRDVQRRLMSSTVKKGDFLVAKRKDFKDSSVLSVKDYDITKGHLITEYPIHQGHDQYHIKADQVFTTIYEMISFYEGKLIEQPIKRPDPIVWNINEIMSKRNVLDGVYLDLTEQVHKGKLVEIWKGTYSGTREICARQLNSGIIERQSLESVCKLLKVIRHENVLRIYGIVVEDQPHSIVTEWMEKRDLLSYLQDGEGADMEMPALLDVAIQIANGMDFLEDRCIVHKDVAARNVLVGSDNVVKVNLYGVARMMEESIYEATDDVVQLPIRWAAPEAIFKRKFSHKSDVWSYGITMVEIFTKGEIPYPEKLSNKQVLESLRKGYRHMKPFGCPDQIYTIMKQCWDEKPARRPEFSKIKDTLQYIYDSKVDNHVVFRDAEATETGKNESESEEEGEDNEGFVPDYVPSAAKRKSVTFREDILREAREEAEPEDDDYPPLIPEEPEELETEQVELEEVKTEEIVCTGCSKQIKEKGGGKATACESCKKWYHKECLSEDDQATLTDISIWRCDDCALYVNAHLNHKL